MPQPPANVIDGDAVQKQVPSVGMSKCMGSHRATLGHGAQGLSPGSRFLRPPPGGRPPGAHYRPPSHAGELKDGGHAWHSDRKRAYANDLSNPAHMVAVTASANRPKGAKRPEAWKPPDEAYWCQYAWAWVAVKVEWGLTVTPAEFKALGEMLETYSLVQYSIESRARLYRRSDS